MYSSERSMTSGIMQRKRRANDMCSLGSVTTTRRGINWLQRIAVFMMLIITGCHAIVRVELEMPRYATRHGDVTLRCNHDVQPEQLHKVEWLKAGSKIFQYVKGRTPPFRNFTIPGATLDWSHTSEKYIQLSKLDFSASGVYSCEVSMETPIYTKESNRHELTIIQPQGYDPKITFGKAEYQVGEILEANCTTSPSRPPPHITWLINKQKVDEHLTKSFSNGRIHGHGFWDRTAPSITRLAIQVSELHAGEDGRLVLECVSTIPAYVSHNGQYADIRQTAEIIDIVTIEVTTTEEPVPISGSSSLRRRLILYLLCIYLLLFN